MKELNKFSIKTRIRSYSFAFNGLKDLIKTEHNARIHLAAMIIVIVFGILFKIDITEWISLTIVVGLVILSELFNTSIEKLSDIVDPERNIKIGQIKDYAAAAVLISAAISIIVGGLIFIPKIIELIKNFY